MRRAILILPLLLAACGEPASKYETDAAAPPAPAPAVLAAPPPTAPTLVWSLAPSGEGDAMVLRDSGKDVLRIACVPGEGLVVYAERLKPVASEERMTIGAGGIITTLVATAAQDRDPPAVKATGALDTALLDAIETSSGKISANYGAQSAGPFDPPPAEVAKAFVAGCRGGGA